MEVFLVVTGVPLLCGAALYLWWLSRSSLEGRILIVALWIVLLLMSITAGEPWVIVMGAATLVMAMLIWAQSNLW